MSLPEEAPTPLPVIEEFEAAGPLVGILIGSESDREAMDPAIDELNERAISHGRRVHRSPGDRRSADVLEDGRGWARRDPLDRPDAARRAGRVRLPERLEERRDPRREDPRAGRRLPGLATAAAIARALSPAEIGPPDPSLESAA